MSEESKPTIEFEGEKVKPDKKGFYKCPFKCGDSRYPSKKWKTEKGFRKHTKECPNRPSLIKEKEKTKEKENELFKEYKNYFLNNDAWEIGTELPVVIESIVKPKYQQRGWRMVRVRYEDVYRYESRVIKVNNYGFIERLPFGLKTDYKTFKHNNIYINNNYNIYSIKNTLEEAKKIAKEKQESHNKGLKQASNLR